MGILGISTGMWGIWEEMHKKMGNQCDDVGNQGGHLGIAVDMTQNNSENDKLKQLREVRIIKNDHICKNFVPHN